MRVVRGRWSGTQKVAQWASALARALVAWVAFFSAGSLYVYAYSRSSWMVVLIAGVAFGIATFVVADAMPGPGHGEN